MMQVNMEISICFSFIPIFIQITYHIKKIKQVITYFLRCFNFTHFKFRQETSVKGALNLN